MKKFSKTRCSDFSTLIKEELAGSAPVWDRLIVISLPLPWVGNINKSTQFHKLFNKKIDCIKDKLKLFRFQFVVPDKDYQSEHLTKIFFFNTNSNHAYFSKFNKMEFDVPKEKISEFLFDLIENNEKYLVEYTTKANNLRDLFVCTHVNRDICCGVIGMPIYKILKERFIDYEASKTRVWRMSHLGGHKYAPNVLDMPSGRFWGRFKPSNIEDIFGLNVNPKKIIDYYRGSVGLNSSYEQLFESRILFDSQNINYKIISDINMLNSKLAKITMERIYEFNNQKSTYTGVIKLNGYTKSIDCVSGIANIDTPKYEIDSFKKYND